ncbi:hypothetical protein [Nocardiopsis lucentensis]|uniref:hypothetical protein n=1 Tax=Nocardiopsis lucentensis TaxID=53441 RepID=UPI00037EE140|nr:hypothetical protein [Nocardiopsis lucentensis]
MRDRAEGAADPAHGTGPPWSLAGLAFGAVLGLTAAFGGFGAFLLVLVLGAAGFLGGRVYEGDIDLAALFAGRQRWGRR